MGSTCNHAISVGLGQWQHICEVGWWWLCGLVAVPPTARHMHSIYANTQIPKMTIISPFRIHIYNTTHR